jgi:hypothetical protein
MYLQMVVPRPVDDCYTFIFGRAVKFHCSKTCYKDCVHVSTPLAGFCIYLKDSVENCEDFNLSLNILVVRSSQFYARY